MTTIAPPTAPPVAPPIPAKPRVAFYARVSTRDKGQDPMNQLLPLRQLAQDRGWSVIREYIEHESASGRVRRAQYAQMMLDAESHQFDILAVWSLDRLSREGVQQTLFDLRRLQNAGVSWYSIQESQVLGLDTLGPFRDVIIALIAAIAQLETNRRSERAKAALTRLRKEGKQIGARAIPIDTAQLAKLYGQGYSVMALAKYFGVSRGTIGNRLIDMGLKERLDSCQPDTENEESK